MVEWFNFGLLAFTSFFSLINPLGVMPVFMTMTSTLDVADRNRTARKAVSVALVTLLLFAFSGQLLFDFFGISVSSFRVAGGVIFFLMGMDMLQARLGKVKIRSEEVRGYVDDISVTPLAIPMICGPGALTNAIIMMEDSVTIELQVVLVLVIVLVLGLTLLILLGASRINSWLGETGLNVLTRLMGLIVMVIAIEFLFAGLTPFIQKFLPV